MKRTITLAAAGREMRRCGINPKIVPVRLFRKGMNIELEHIRSAKIPYRKVARIVIDHLCEYPDYYQRLLRMEHEADRFWNRRKKPSIFV